MAKVERSEELEGDEGDQDVSGGDVAGCADGVFFGGRIDGTCRWKGVMSSRKVTVVLCSGHAVQVGSAPGRREWKSEAWLVMNRTKGAAFPLLNTLFAHEIPTPLRSFFWI